MDTAINNPQIKEVWLDDNVHNTYAQELLPRAVGYSAALIDYFFRGQLDLIRDETSPGYIIVNRSNEPMEGMFQLFTDDTAGNRTPLLSSPLALTLLASGATDTITGAPLDRSEPIEVTLPSEDSPIIIVFQGKLGNEIGAVAGRVIRNGVYMLAIPVDHSTRELRAKRYYRVQGDTLAPVAEAALPFGLLDDGAGWDQATMSWKKIDPQGLGIPLGTGGPQYLAKYRDEANQRVRFVSNLSYEKEAYQPFRMSYEIVSGVTVSYNRVVYVGNPETAAGMYNENTGWMAYAGAPLNGLVAVLSPPGTDPRTQRFFPGYKTANFNDRFIETPKLAYYGFDNTTAEQDIVKDPEAPLPAVVSVSRSSGTGSVKVAVPTIFDSYVMPHPTRTPASGLASSGLDRYTYTVGAVPVLDGFSPKCSGETNNCGAAYDPSQGPRPVSAVYDIPSNDDSMVRVHFGENDHYYEELFINGILVQTSPPSADRLETHYQVLAVHGGAAVVRITSLAAQQEQALPYWHQAIGERIIDRQVDFVSTYVVYINGARYDLTGTTNVRSHYLATRYEQGMDVNALSPVRYLTYDLADDITGFHPDRIFINETFDGRQVLVAFDEYAYNNGEGLVHQLRYQPISAAANADRVLFFDIATAKLQNADHEAVRSRRKLLLFNADGTLRTALQDPIGLNDSIGSIGILN